MNRYTNIGKVIITSSGTGKAKVRIVQNTGLHYLLWAGVLALVVAAGAGVWWLVGQERPAQEMAQEEKGVEAKPERETVVVPAPAENSAVKAEMSTPVSGAEAEMGDPVQHAQQLASQGQFNEAIEAYRKALLQEPANDTARQGMVELLLKARRTQDAERALQLGLKYNPKRTTYYMQLARLQAGRNATTQALDTLLKGESNAKHQADYQAFIASLLQRLGRHTSAVVYYKQALELQPGAGEWLLGMGISLKAVQRNTEANDALRKALDSGNLSAQAQAQAEDLLKQGSSAPAATPPASSLPQASQPAAQ